MSPAQELTYPKVLIMDDDADTAEMYAVALSSAGYQTVEAHCAEEALSWIQEETPAAVVTDLAVPGRMDGLEFTRRLRRDERTRTVPVIVVSGLPQWVYAQAALRAGCELFLPKPCPPDELAHHVGRAISESRAAA